MKEPYKIVKTIDESRYSSSGATVPGLVIGAVVNSPSGRTERVLVKSQSDFINEYLVNDSILASDDTTIHHIARVLNKSPMYIIRVDNSNIRVGISSNGKKLYFDKNYNLLPNYTTFEFNSIPEVKLATIDLLVTYNDKSYYFYMGEFDAANAGDAIAIQVMNGEPDIDNFIRYLNYAYYTSNDVSEDDKLLLPVLYTEDDIIRIRGTATSPSEAFSVYKTSNLTGNSSNSKLYKYEFSTDSAKSYGTDDRVRVGNSFDYYCTGAPSDSWVNARLLHSYSLTYTNSMSYDVLGLALVNSIYNNDDLPSPLMSNQSSTVNFSLLNSLIDLSKNVTVDVPEKYRDCVSISFNNNGTSADVTVNVVKDVGTVTDFTLTIGFINGENAESEIIFYHSANTEVASTTRSNVILVPVDSTESGIGLNKDPLTISMFMLLAYEVCKYTNVLTLEIDGQKYKYIDGGDATTHVVNTNEIFYETDMNPGIAELQNTNAIAESTAVKSDDVYTEIIHSTTESNALNTEYNQLWVRFDDTEFYSGNAPVVLDPNVNLVRLSSKKLSVSEFLNLLYNTYPTYFTGSTIKVRDADNNIHRLMLFSDNVSISVSDGIELLNTDKVDQTGCKDRFAIVTNFPSTKDIFRFSYTKNTEDYDDVVYEAKLYYKGEPTEVTFSFNDSISDGLGKSLYYGIINEGTNRNEYYRIVDLEGTVDRSEYTSNSFGSEVVTTTPTAVDYQNAAARFMEYDDIYYDIIWDAGAPYPSYLTYLSTICQSPSVDELGKLNALAVGSIPPTIKTKADMIAYAESVGVDNNYLALYGPGYITDAFGGYSSKFSASTAVIEKIIDNFNSVTEEFTPIYGPKLGLVTAPNITVNLSRDDREELLDSRINTIFNGKKGPQLNFNKTCIKTKSYLDEEQNVRLANVIAHVADEYAESLIGRINDEITRNEVVSVLTDKIKDRVVSQKSKCVEKIRVICDETNNPQNVIDNQQIVITIEVQYLRSIAYVTIYNKVKKVGSF